VTDGFGNILITGGNGMLGTAWRQRLDEAGIAYRSTDRESLDITDPSAVRQAIRDDIDLVINCAAYTNVDGAEDDEATATQINGEAVGHLAERCRQVDASLVHYSTDYVFNGQATTPYPIDAPIEPINAYGRSKADGEQRLRDSGCRHLLIRTSWLYAPWGHNFVLTMTRLTAERDALRVVSDQVGRPTSCEHLAATTLKLIETGATGTFHVTDGGQCSWHQFASAIGAAINPACRVDPCTTDEFPRPAKRPAYSVLDLTATEAIVGPMCDWQDNLAGVLARHREAQTT